MENTGETLWKTATDYVNFFITEKIFIKPCDATNLFL